MIGTLAKFQPTFTCSKSPTKTVEKGVRYVQIQTM